MAAFQTVISLAVLFAKIYASDITDLCPYNLQRGPHLRVFEHSGSCYEFLSQRHDSWYNAQKDCSSKGGHLVVINNIEEENFIMSVLASLNFGGLGVWIGLNDIAEEGVFKWITGASPQFTFWGARQGPNAGVLHLAHGIEDCVLLKFADSGHWHDYPCESIALLLENYSWICQYVTFLTFVRLENVTRLDVLSQYIGDTRGRGIRFGCSLEDE